jgi:serine phosphatase RsbU (regulator of sigma subunit)
VEFSAGDSLLCYTDGLVEIDDVLWDDEALASYLEAVDPMVRCDPEELIANVLSYVRNRARVWNRDDVTVMAASRLL